MLVHGINNRALWMDDVKPALENSGFAVAATSYGRFSIARFLAPFTGFRNKAIERVAKDIRTAIRAYKQDTGSDPKRMSVISHSFGTYVVGKLLTDYPEFKWYRVIFCGSVVREDFPLDQVLGRFADPLLNEIGTKDFWPALAESAGWDYGSVGSTGFNSPPVETRWHHGYRHSDFLTEEFCNNFWIPFLEGAKAKRADKSEQLPLAIRILAMLPLRWIILVVVPIFLASIGYFFQAEARRAFLIVQNAQVEGSWKRTEMTCPLTPPASSLVVREGSAEEILNLLAALEPWRRDDKFQELYLNRFIGRDGWTGTVREPPDLKDGLCRFMVSEDGTSARILVNTCEHTCNYRRGDRIQLSGWLMHRDDNYVEIGTGRHTIVTGVGPRLPKTSVPTKAAIVCHGEDENACKEHKYDVFELCSEANGVGGADPNVSGRAICGDSNFDVSPAEGGSIRGNHCGYSWYRITCK